jgi:hypothetical protein
MNKLGYIIVGAFVVMLAYCGTYFTVTTYASGLKTQVLAAEDVPEYEKEIIEEDLDLEELMKWELDQTFMKEEPVLVPDFTWKPNGEQLQIIGRMAEGIYKWKARVHDGKETARYYDCGEWYQGDKAKDRALLWAFNIVRASDEASIDLEVELNPWGVAGTTANESAFDLCCFGLHPRKAAYKIRVGGPKGAFGKYLLQSSRYTVSHSRDDVIAAINHPKLKNKFRTYDLGGLQVLAAYYRGPMEKLLTWEGYYWQVRWMAKKIRTYKTKNPWAYWPGHYALWKHKKVVRHARRLGATPEEIRL